MSDKKIAVASDHAGRELKDDIKALLIERGMEVVDFGADSDESVDYPDFGIALSEKVSSGDIERGILVCGTGIGMSMVANKFRNVRAALVGDLFSARMSREHNDSNVLVIGGRVTGKDLAFEIVRVWLDTKFEGGRHQRRLDKISAISDK